MVSPVLKEGLPPQATGEPEGHRVRDGTLERMEFIAQVAPIRQAVHQLLTAAADDTVADGEKTPLFQNRADL